MLQPPSSSPIPWTCRLSSTDAYVIVVLLFVLIFHCWRLHRRFIFLGPVVYPLPPPSLSPILWTHRTFLVLCWRLRCCHWFRGPILLCWHRRCCCQYPETVNAPAPPPLEKFTHTHCIFCFLNWSLHCCRKILGLIFLCRHLRGGRQFLRPVIATYQLPPLSLNLWSLGKIVYVLSSADPSVVVVDSMSQSVKDYSPIGCWISFFSGDGLNLYLLGALV